MMYLKLTDWETGELVYVQKREIVVCRRLRAYVIDSGDGTKTRGERTRIDAGRDTLLVRELPQDIMESDQFNVPGEQPDTASGA